MQTGNYIDVQVQPVQQAPMDQVRWLSFQVVNPKAMDDTYGLAQYQLYNSDNQLLGGYTVGFSDEDSRNWKTDQEFADWLTVHKLNYIPII